MAEKAGKLQLQAPIGALVIHHNLENSWETADPDPVYVDDSGVAKVVDVGRNPAAIGQLLFKGPDHLCVTLP